LRQVGGESFLRWVRATDLLFANSDEAVALLQSQSQTSQPQGSSPQESRPQESRQHTVGDGFPGADTPNRLPTPSDTQAAGDLARALAAWVGAAVVKLGAVGAVSADLGDPGFAEAAAVPADAIDATGAGDAFAAGYLAAWLSGARGAAALRAATVMGAEAVARVGARPPRHGSGSGSAGP
jgi:sugar/nucleoside kinase (ribokinase family)